MNESYCQDCTMTKNKILETVAAVMLALRGVLTGIISLAVGWLIDLIAKKKTKEIDNETEGYYEEQHFEPTDQLVRTYGDPDNLIIVDATRANETDGAILVYSKDRFLVVEGIKVYFNEIEEVTFHNDQHIYSLPQYVVVINTRLHDHASIRLQAGPDVTWAGEVVAEIKKSIIDQQP